MPECFEKQWGTCEGELVYADEFHAFLCEKHLKAARRRD